MARVAKLATVTVLSTRNHLLSLRHLSRSPRKAKPADPLSTQSVRPACAVVGATSAVGFDLTASLKAARLTNMIHNQVLESIFAEPRTGVNRNGVNAPRGLIDAIYRLGTVIQNKAAAIWENDEKTF